MDLITAAKAGDTTKVRALLLQQADLDAVDAHRWTALMWASYEGHKEVVEALLARSDSSVNTSDDKGQSALILAASCGRVEIAGLLLAHGAFIDYVALDGCTSLMASATANHCEVVDLLVASGADLNCVDDKKQTALMHAAINGHDKVVAMLLSKGADKSITDKTGPTALQLSKTPGVRQLLKVRR